MPTPETFEDPAAGKACALPALADLLVNDLRYRSVLRAERDSHMPLLSSLGDRARGAYHSRAAWGARAPRGGRSFIDPRGVACHYVDEVVANIGHDRCAALMRSIQNLHMDVRGWADFAYSLAVCRHGDVWEGRGPRVRTAANGSDHGNSNYLAIVSLLGNEPMPAGVGAGINQAAAILEVADGHWTTHGRLFSTSCPGPVITRWVDAGHPADAGPDAPPPPPPDPWAGGLFEAVFCAGR